MRLANNWVEIMEGTDFLRAMSGSTHPTQRSSSDTNIPTYSGLRLGSNYSFDSNSSSEVNMGSSTSTDMFQRPCAKQSGVRSMKNAPSSVITELERHSGSLWKRSGSKLCNIAEAEAELALELSTAHSRTSSDVDRNENLSLLKGSISPPHWFNNRKRPVLQEESRKVEVLDRISESSDISPFKFRKIHASTEHQLAVIGSRNSGYTNPEKSFPSLNGISVRQISPDSRCGRRSVSAVNKQLLVHRKRLQVTKEPAQACMFKHRDNKKDQPSSFTGFNEKSSRGPLFPKEVPKPKTLDLRFNCSNKISVGDYSVVDTISAGSVEEREGVLGSAMAQHKSRTAQKKNSDSRLDFRETNFAQALYMEKHIMQKAEKEAEGTDPLGGRSVSSSVELPSSAGNSIDEDTSLSRSCSQERTKECLSSTAEKEDKAVQETGEGLQLVSLLLKCATAVAKNEKYSAGVILGEIYKRAGMYGDAMQRLSVYFAESLAARLVLKDSPLYNKLMPRPSHEELFRSFAALHKVSPCFQFAHFTSNQAIVEAFEGHQNLHVIDVNMVRGFQWASLLQSLASRSGRPPTLLRLTAVGRSEEMMRETAHRLSNFAKHVNISFEFEAIVEDRLESLSVERFAVKPGEAIAVNCVFELHRLLNDQSGGKIRQFVSTMRRLKPTVLTIVEQEANHNAPTFLGRFMESLHYYAAIFDSLDASFPRQSDERLRIEQVFFARQIRNIVACEDGERVERHEKTDSWKHRMENAGFQQMHFSEHAVSQAKLLLQLCPCDGYCLTEKGGVLSLGWQERQLITASAWTASRAWLNTHVLSRQNNESVSRTFLV